MANSGTSRWRRWLLRPSVLVTLVLVALALVGGRLIAMAVDEQEQRLLQERANEVGLVLGASISALSEGMGSIGAALEATDESPAAFGKAGDLSLDDMPNAGVALARPSEGDAFVVVLERGDGLEVGQLLTGTRAEAMAKAMTSEKIVPTGVIGRGSQRFLGFALGPPAAPDGKVLYRQTALGPLSPPRAASTAPFSEIDVVLYSTPTADPANAVVATSGTAGNLPLSGQVITQPLPVGASNWTLQVEANRPMVGSLATYAGWIVAGAGIVIALLVGAVMESAIRRREAAEALYNSEHRIAEKLQRGFLPALPDVDGLEIAARYLAGSADQQVGGDWYDVFVRHDGGVGVVIGDVLGHDVNAAVIMSRIQTALRAYACQGADPSEVLDTLDEHIDDVQAGRLTTLFYGVLGAPDADGSRTFRFANAGHLHPLVRHPDGTVEELVTARSTLVGVPGGFGAGRSLSETRLPVGAVLVLFTDGLVEVPEVPLTDSIHQLKDVARTAPAGIGPEQLCDRLIGSMAEGELRDDVAVLAVKLVGVLDGVAKMNHAAAEPSLVEQAQTDA